MKYLLAWIKQCWRELSCKHSWVRWDCYEVYECPKCQALRESKWIKMKDTDKHVCECCGHENGKCCSCNDKGYSACHCFIIEGPHACMACEKGRAIAQEKGWVDGVGPHEY